MSRSPEFQNPHVDHTPEVEVCKFCGAAMPEDWDVQGWRELPLRSRLVEAWCCEPCYWAEVYDGPLQDDRGPYGPTTEQQAEMQRLRR